MIECMDCHLDYSTFPLDVVLSKEQWLMIHPEDGGVLCGNCIAERASKLPHIIHVRVTLEFAEDISMTPLTQHEWDTLGDEERWDCLTALRGPDYLDSMPGTMVKYLTTGIIRYKLSQVIRCAGVINSSLSTIIRPMPCVESEAHYFNHISAAANTLKIPCASMDRFMWETVIKSASLLELVRHTHRYFRGTEQHNYGSLVEELAGFFKGAHRD